MDTSLMNGCVLSPQALLASASSDAETVPTCSDTDPGAEEDPGPEEDNESSEDGDDAEDMQGVEEGKNVQVVKAAPARTRAKSYVYAYHSLTLKGVCEKAAQTEGSGREGQARQEEGSGAPAEGQRGGR